MNLATVGYDIHNEESEEEISKIDNKEEWRDDISTDKKKENEVMLDRLKRKNLNNFEECFPTWGHIRGAHGKYVQIHEKRSEKSSSSVQKDSDEVLIQWLLLIWLYGPKFLKSEQSRKSITPLSKLNLRFKII